MKRWATVSALGGLLAIIFAVLWWVNQLVETPVSETETNLNAVTGSSSDIVPERYPAGLTRNEYHQALQWFEDLYPGSSPNNFDIASLAGELAVADGRMETAVRCFSSIPTDHAKYGLAARIQQGTALLELNKAKEAEENLRAYLDAARRAPQVRVDDVVLAFKWLNYILSVELRLEERKIVLADVHQLGLADILDSKQYFFPNLLILNSPAGRQRIAAFVQLDPDNLELQTAKARYMTLEGKFDEALEVLKPLLVRFDLNTQPGRKLAAATLEAYYESGLTTEFDSLAEQLPPYASEEPWLLTRFRGEYALQLGQLDKAVEYFNHVLREDPANPQSQMGLATALGRLDETALQQEAQLKSGILADIRVNLSNIQSDHLAAVENLVTSCETIGFQEAAQVFKLHAQALKQQATPPNQP